MTADLSEGETESRPLNPSSDVRFKVDEDVGPLDRDRLKGGHWKHGKDIELAERVERVREVESGEDNRGTADLTTGFKDGLRLRPRLVSNDATGQGKQGGGRGPRLPSRESRKVAVLSSEGDRDEQTEDDFVEGDGTVPEVASEPMGNQQEQPQQQSQDQGQIPQRKEPKEQAPQPAQVPVSPVGWESFLPQSKIKVLLAEDDDSTRQVVGALLRNCSYEVSSVANGMQAWEMLEDPNNQFDLVLADVVMPCLSGVGLLSKITSNESSKRIPVIMMSSHDSLDIVFRCLSKGAADFLVKPVRKNELKNLWQHVWRCQSSSGSGSGGSGSGTGNLKVARSKSKVGSGNNTGSNGGSDDNSSGLNVRGGSDNGSGTQAVVHTSHKPKRDKPEIKGSQATSSQKLSDEQMGQDLEMATRRPTSLDLEKAPKPDNEDGADAMEDDAPSTSGNSGNKRSNSGTGKAIDLIGGIAFQSNEDVDDGVESGDGVEGSDRGASNSPANDKCVTSSNSPPLLELSLKRPRPADEEDNTDKRVIRYSGGSAFSRYSSTGGTTIQQIPPGTPLTVSGYPMGAAYGTLSPSPATGPLGTGSNVPGRFSMPLDRARSSKGSGEGSNQQPMHPRPSHRGKGKDLGSSVVGSSTPEGYSQQVKDETLSAFPISGQGRPISIPLPPRGMMYDGVSAAYGQAMYPVYYSHNGAPPWASGGPHLSDREQVFDHPPYHDHGSHTALHSSQHLQQQAQHHQQQAQHHQQQAQHHQHHSRLPQPSLRTQQEGQDVINQASGAPGCGSSNMADGNTGQSGSSNGYGSGNGNGSVNGSGSGSNNLTTQNGSCVVVNPTENNECAVMNGSAPGEPNGDVDHEQMRFSRREAALNKFRQKRKERCFEKKVRYQSRKRLAEQRPRVRGQFVRQPVYEPNAGASSDCTAPARDIFECRISPCLQPSHLRGSAHASLMQPWFVQDSILFNFDTW